MKYVVAGNKLADPKNGVYAQFENLSNWIGGFGGRCVWGRVSSATIFDTAEEAKQAIVAYPWWVENCGAVVATIHPLNLVNR